ncbi:MAG TPA: NADP-dependent oxidoreductase [Candidatus Saccharimonadales bacterium]|nr:NADP-dependent oxidoreductase [Candidatus Saccharimonadales bacterium]
MRAAQLTHYGGQDAVQFTAEAPVPEVTPGHVLVKVTAASINAIDWKIREGMMQQMAPVNFPATLGGDLAGTVEAIGEGVEAFTVGQEVYGQTNPFSGHGSFAEYSLIPAGNLAQKPQTTNAEQTAALPLTAVSTYQALVETLNLQPGQKILIHGGAGGIGSFAIQLAKHLGAYVATTAATDDLEFVRQMGADEAIDYTSQKFEEIISGYDAVFDTAGGDATEKSYGILKSGGQLVSMAAMPNDELAREHGVTASAQQTRVTTERLQKVAELVDQGILKPAIDRTFPLEQAAEALEYMRRGHHRGKVVINVAD